MHQYEDTHYHRVHILAEPGDFVDLRADSTVLFSTLLPTPSLLEGVDEFDATAFQLLNGDVATARRMFRELGEPWPFETDRPTAAQVGLLTREQPFWQEAATKAVRAMHSTGFLQAKAWRQQNWGAPREPERFQVEHEGRGSWVVHVQDTQHCYLPALLGLASRYPRARVQAVVVSYPQNKQYCFDTQVRNARGVLSLRQQALDLEDPQWKSWLAADIATLLAPSLAPAAVVI